MEEESIELPSELRPVLHSPEQIVRLVTPAAPGIEGLRHDEVWFWGPEGPVIGIDPDHDE